MEGGNGLTSHSWQGVGNVQDIPNVKVLHCMGHFGSSAPYDYW